MNFVKPLAISFSMLAFTMASAYALAQDKSASQESPAMSQSSSAGGTAKQDFSKLDKDGDGALSRMEAAADEDAKSNFEKLDQNQDQKLSQQEYQGSQFAQSAQSQQQQPKQEPQAQSKSGSEQSQQQGQMGTSQLIGKKVSDSQGEELGEIKDVVIDLQGGKVHAAVIEFGGVLGMGAKQYAFPISDLKPGKSKDQLMLNVEKQKLKNAEGFAKGQWPEMNDEYWGRVGGQASTGASKAKGTILVRASKMKGQKVQDKSGEEVGEIKDIMVDLKSGQLGEIVVDVKDAGQAKVPAKSLIKGTGDKLVLDMNAKELKSQAKQSGGQAQSKQQDQGASTGSSTSQPGSGQSK